MTTATVARIALARPALAVVRRLPSSSSPTPLNLQSPILDYYTGRVITFTDGSCRRLQHADSPVRSDASLANLPACRRLHIEAIESSQAISRASSERGRHVRHQRRTVQRRGGGFDDYNGTNPPPSMATVRTEHRAVYGERPSAPPTSRRHRPTWWRSCRTSTATTRRSAACSWASERAGQVARADRPGPGPRRLRRIVGRGRLPEHVPGDAAADPRGGAELRHRPGDTNLPHPAVVSPAGPGELLGQFHDQNIFVGHGGLDPSTDAVQFDGRSRTQGRHGIREPTPDDDDPMPRSTLAIEQRDRMYNITRCSIFRPMPWDHPNFTGSNPALVGSGADHRVPMPSSYSTCCAG